MQGKNEYAKIFSGTSLIDWDKALDFLLASPRTVTLMAAATHFDPYSGLTTPFGLIGCSCRLFKVM